MKSTLVSPSPPVTSSLVVARPCKGARALIVVLNRRSVRLRGRLSWATSSPGPGEGS